MSANDESRVATTAVEAALADLQPAAAEIDRDALLYRAGYAAAEAELSRRRSPTTFWQASTGLMTAATVAMAVMLANDRSGSPPPLALAEPGEPSQDRTVTEQPERVAVEDATAAEQVVVSTPLLRGDPTENYLALRAAVLQWGVEAWPTDFREAEYPASHSQPGRPSTTRSLLDELLPQSSPTTPPDDDQPSEASQRDQESIV